MTVFNKCVVVGGGPVGSLTACAMKMQGKEVTLYEKSEAIEGIIRGQRSISLTLTVRGLRAIQRILGSEALQDLLKSHATKCPQRVVHLSSGKTFLKAYDSVGGESLWCIQRCDLTRFMLQWAQRSGVKVEFDHELQEVDFSEDHCTLHFKGDKKIELSSGCPLLAVDGVNSAVRKSMENKGLTNYNKELLDCGYWELELPGQESILNGQAGLHVWPSSDQTTTLLGLPSQDGFDGLFISSRESLEQWQKDPTQCANFFEQHCAGAVEVLGGKQKLKEQISKIKLGNLNTVTCETWFYKSLVLLLGDAAQGVTPFYGQGCNRGFEDVLELFNQVAQMSPQCSDDDLEKCFKSFQMRQRGSAKALAEMCLENFQLLREGPHEGKQLMESLLEKSFPKEFCSRYRMVCFGGEGNLSYENARTLANMQDSIIERLYQKMMQMMALSTEQPLPEVSLEQVQQLVCTEEVQQEAKKLILEELVPLQDELKVDLRGVSCAELSWIKDLQ